MTSQAPGETLDDAAHYSLDGHIATITLNRPHVRNAVNAAVSAAAGHFLERAAADPDVRVVIITGAGSAFCAGADLKELAAGHSVLAPKHPEWGLAGIVRHWIAKPVIAAVQGYALGGGTEIALACDLVVLAEDASLGLPEVKRGLLAAAGGLIRLQRQIPFRRALELALTGDAVDAKTALDWGIANVIAGQGKALDVAHQLAERIAANAPLSVRASKLLMHRLQHAGSEWGFSVNDVNPWRLSNELAKQTLASADAREGALAFAEKRSPVWSDR